MKIKSLGVLVALCMPTFLFAGGLVTNTNQSASFIRMPSLDAVIGIEGVYYNPAGLVQLENGLHVSLSNQIVNQKRSVTSTFPTLNSSDYDGIVKVPLFPSAYVAYKANKLVFSFAFNPIGGGGGAEYENGLPSFESMVSQIPGMVTLLGVPTTAYSMDLFFNGSSTYFGYQVGISYAINDAIGVFGGARYVTAKNTYEGNISDIMINPQHPVVNPSGGMMLANTFFTQIGQPVYAAMTADAEVDVVQKGSGVAPIIGLSIVASDKLNFGVKYEFKTKMELTTETKVDGTGMFPDGEVISNDMPAMLTLGVGYKPIDKLSLLGGFHYYFDKSANYGKKINGVFVENSEVIDNNYWEAAIGLEYMVTGKIFASAGYLYTKTGVNEKYQSDMSYSLNTNSVGLGGKYLVNENLGINIGFMTTLYQSNTKDYAAVAPATPAYSETYNRTNRVIALGVDYKF
jgi:long-chain fatty acid transport protein